jgi:viroplasmin and RNaseH domain-containing protein
MKKWYVVFKGRTPGVCDNWNSCLAQVFGFSHASYQSFKSKEEALLAYGGSAMQVDDGPVKQANSEVTKICNVQGLINTTSLVMIMILLVAIVLKLYSK